MIIVRCIGLSYHHFYAKNWSNFFQLALSKCGRYLKRTVARKDLSLLYDLLIKNIWWRPIWWRHWVVQSAAPPNDSEKVTESIIWKLNPFSEPVTLFKNAFVLKRRGSMLKSKVNLWLQLLVHLLFSTPFSVFGNVMKLPCLCLIYLITWNFGDTLI